VDRHHASLPLSLWLLILAHPQPHHFSVGCDNRCMITHRADPFPPSRFGQLASRFADHLVRACGSLLQLVLHAPRCAALALSVSSPLSATRRTSTPFPLSPSSRESRTSGRLSLARTIYFGNELKPGPGNFFYLLAEVSAPTSIKILTLGVRIGMTHSLVFFCLFFLCERSGEGRLIRSSDYFGHLVGNGRVNVRWVLEYKVGRWREINVDWRCVTVVGRVTSRSLICLVFKLWTNDSCLHFFKHMILVRRGKRPSD
jgi:hypothetical protein